MNRLGLLLLSIGHFGIDVNPGALPALLPTLFAEFGLSYTSAALVVTTASITSSMLQPLFGLVADRLTWRGLLPFSCLIAPLGLALASQAPSYGVLLALVVCSSVGVALFHPEAARTASRLAGDRRATGMAIFTVGGNLGVAAGPLVMGGLIAAYGRPGAAGLALVGLAIAPLLLLGMPRVRTAPVAAVVGGAASLPGDNRAHTLLVAVVFFRQWCQTGLITFVPLYVVFRLGESAQEANSLVAALLFGSVAGTLIGGPLADRFGRRPVLTGSMVLAAPILYGFLWSSGLVAMLLLFVGGTALLATASVTVVMGQELMPRRAALSSGLTIGFASGLAGLGGVALGWLADAVGVESAIAAACLMPLVGATIALALPDTLRPQLAR